MFKNNILCFQDVCAFLRKDLLNNNYLAVNEDMYQNLGIETNNIAHFIVMHTLLEENILQISKDN